MILDKHSAQALSHLRPSNIELDSAYVLNQCREPISCDGHNLSSILTLRYNHFRPLFDLKLRLPPCDDKVKIESDLANLHLSTSEKAGSDGDKHKEITIEFTRGTKIDLYAKTNSDDHAQSSSQPFGLLELPDSTRDIVSRMYTPVVLGFSGGKHEILTIGLSLNYPVWAEPIREMVFSDQYIMILVDVGNRMLSLKRLKTHMETGNNPLDKFCPTGLNASNRYDAESFIANPVSPGLLGYRASPVFKNLQEYTVAGLAAIEIDREPEVRQIKALEKHSKRLILIDFEGEKFSKEYEGLIDRPRSSEFKLQPGQSFEIHFNTHVSPSASPPWRATVMPEGTVKKTDMLSLYVHRGQSKGSLEYATNVPPVIDATQLSDEQLQELFKKNEGDKDRLPSCKVKVKLIDPNSVYFNTRTSYTISPYSTRMGEIMTGLRPHELQFMDLYRSIQRDIPRLQKYMLTLNPQQLEVVQAVRNIRGGMLIVQGPPGTGKTHTLLQLAIWFVLSILAAEERTTILIAAPTNAGADDLMQGLCEILASFQNRHPELKPGRYILRAYPEKAEDQISRSQGAVPSTSLPTAGMPSKTPLPHSSTEVGKRKILKEFRAADKPRFHGVRDKRVTDIKHSIGYMRLLISGAIPGSEHAHPDAERFATFRGLHRKQRLGKTLSDSEENLWKRASAIISTTATISKASLLACVKSQVTAVFLDESGFEREDSLRPLLGAAFKLDPCFVLIGDQDQLAPITADNEEENDFRPQLKMSLMARMIDYGMDYTMLTEQHRMVPEISEIANKMTYGGKLTDNPCTMLENRPLAREFREFTRIHYDGMVSNRLMIDLPRSKTNIADKNDGKSKSNDFSICIVAQIIVKLLRHFGSKATVGVLTPYTGQRYKYTLMEGKMRDAKLENFDKVSISTVDGAIGRQFDIVIFDLVVSQSAGFLEEEKRMNVALTRARDGMIVVCNKERIMTTYYKKPRSTQYLLKMMPLFEEHTWGRAKDDGFPHTDFYDPSVPEKKQ